MSTSQSRYGIMDSLNSKKNTAQKQADHIEQELAKQKLAFDNVIHKLKNRITQEKTNYVGDFEHWKANKEFELKELEINFEAEKLLAEQRFETAKEKLKELLNVSEIRLIKIEQEPSLFSSLAGVMSQNFFQMGRGIGTAIKELDNPVSKIEVFT